MPTDLQIARAVVLRPIAETAAALGVPASALVPYGRDIAKLDAGFVDGLAGRPKGRLVLVTAISPTPAGEGKTTTTIGLGDALARIGQRVAVCLREPSLGPCFGQKGGATGGGRSQVAPMDRINLHFTGDIHAITSAHNLLAAAIDNHIYWGNRLELDPRRIAWRRVLDVNDRALRSVVSSLGGVANGFPREDGFDITVASEVMAVFCLARDLDDLSFRLGRMVVARTTAGRAVTVDDLGMTGAMVVLLQDALQPNLVQTLEGTPALIHGGPFANIAHGCNSVLATRTGLALADIVVTEAGFGADLGAEKFFNIKCRGADLAPGAVVIVATLRALKMHGGSARETLGIEDEQALARGFANLARHVRNLRGFGFDPVVAINHFATDHASEQTRLEQLCQATFGEAPVLCHHWERGSAGAEALAHAVMRRLDDGPPARLVFSYPDGMPLLDKLRTLAQSLYGAADVSLSIAATRQMRELEREGCGALPICVAKTPYSFSADPALRGAPDGHVLAVDAFRLMAGAGFVTALCGEIRTMPGLPRVPAALGIRLENGQVEGLS